MNTFIAPLVGMRYHPPAPAVLNALPGGTPLILDLEPSNPHDRNSVRVLVAKHDVPLDDNLGMGLLNFGTEWDDLPDEIMLGYIAATHALRAGNIVEGCPDHTSVLGFGPDSRPVVELTYGE